MGHAIEAPFMVDLFAGRGGASRAMRDRGWRVVTVEIDPVHAPSIVGDVQALPLKAGLRPDLLWCSPPCNEFSASYMPWLDKTNPSLDLVRASQDAVRWLQPRFWVIENVQGARSHLAPLLGPHTLRLGYAYLWGEFPLPLMGARPTKRKQSRNGYYRAHRAEVPYEISEALAISVELALEYEAEPRAFQVGVVEAPGTPR